jgi:hypothetical protein
LGKNKNMAIDYIFETTWSSNNDFGSFPKIELLLFYRTLDEIEKVLRSSSAKDNSLFMTYTTDDGNAFITKRAGKFTSLGFNLLGKLASWCQYESKGPKMSVFL